MSLRPCETMTELTYPSGQWVGFYTYTRRRQRFLMDLLLEFRDGLISGEGADGLGLFAIDGRYGADDGECAWIKTYFGRHSVEYTGYREKKGIWGTWKIRTTTGGFHIWPIGEGAALRELKTLIEQEAPLSVEPVADPVGEWTL